MPEQTLGGIPLGLGMVMKINFLNFHVLIVNYIIIFSIDYDDKRYYTSNRCLPLVT